MSKEWKAPDKVTQKMTRDGAVAENLTTGETSSISERPQEENYSAPAGAAAEKVVQHIGAEIERHAAKGAEKKALDAAQPKTHSSRLQFSEAERATPDLQKAIKKSDTAADRLDKARAAIPKQTKIKKERVFDEAKGKGSKENGAGNQTGDVLCRPALERLFDRGRDCLYRASVFRRFVLLFPVRRQQRKRLDCVVLSLRGRGYYRRRKRVCRYGSRVTGYAG